MRGAPPDLTLEQRGLEVSTHTQGVLATGISNIAITDR